MKSYLGLIPVSARVHRRRNRMTLLCIIIAVFLVTTIFSMADMGIRMETMHAAYSHGNWHIMLSGLSESDALAISSRPDIAAVSWYETVNLDMDQEYSIRGKQTAICGVDGAFVTDIMNYFTEGSRLEDDGEIILSANAKELLGVNMGDSVTLDTPAGSYAFTISGFRSSDSAVINSNGGETTALLVQEDQIGAFMTMSAFREICNANGEAISPQYYIEFAQHANVRKSLAELKEAYELTEESMEMNTIIMAAMGLSDSPYIMTLYFVAAILFVLILIAGILMISGSLNSNITERSQFFGMLRCIGASRKQIIRFVRLEALNWCKTAIPTGIAAGTATTWGLCAVLRYMVGGEFSDMPVFGVSAVGILCGIVVGVLTVFLAAQSPARRAARVSPVAAVSNNTENTQTARRGAKLRFNRIETTLGIHHAASARKNLFLMTGSFALSIILFLSFSVLTELVGILIPQKTYAPDLEITSPDLSNSIDSELVAQISESEGVAHVMGRMSVDNVPAAFDRIIEQNTIDIISYSEYQLSLLPKDKDLKKGSDLTGVYGDSNDVLLIYDKDVPLETGDTIWTCGAELEIAGMLKYSPFSNDGSTNGEIIIICSEETFTRLTDESDYAIVDIQMMKDATDEDADRIRRLTGDRYHFRDRRDEADKSTYWAFMLFVYGFLAIIALITMLYIMNSISMSVSARIRQYGAMRAVGMDGKQLTGMIAAEAFTYALSGCIVGCVIGVPLNKLLYEYLITSHYYYFTWSVPMIPLAVIVVFVLATVSAAIYAPSRRIREMTVTDTINEL